MLNFRENGFFEIGDKFIVNLCRGSKMARDQTLEREFRQYKLILLYYLLLKFWKNIVVEEKIKMLISVIIPVYNVEKYIRRCIESIRKQTYPTLEIILIDDGSTDKSGNICDALAEIDKRIKVIHKKNAGQSSARNVGLDIAKGDMFAFVDADDYVEPNYIEVLYENMKNNDADISVCEFYRVKDDKRALHQVPDNCEVCDNKKALKLLLIEKNCSNYMWNKLFRGYLFEEIRFPEGKIWEDVQVMAELFYRAKKVSFIKIPLYNYVWREDSTVERADLGKYVDFFRVMLYRYQMLGHDSELLPYVQCGLVTGYRMELYHITFRNLNRDNYNLIKRDRMIVKQLVDKKTVCSLLTWKQLLMYELGIDIPAVAVLFYHIQRFMKR